MSPDRQRLSDYLGHVLNAIERIQRFTESLDEASFLQNDMVQDAVIRNFEIIGEDSHNIEREYPEFSEANRDLPFSIAYEMRNSLSHGYFKVDLKIVWTTINNDLPQLRKQIKSIIESMME